MSLAYITGLVFTSVLFIFLGVYNFKSTGRQEFNRRVSTILEEKGKKEPGEKTGPRAVKASGGGLYEALKNSLGSTRLKGLVEKELASADLPLRSEEYLAFTVVVVGFVVLSVLVLTGSLLMLTFTLAIMLPVPYVFIRWAKHKRLAALNSQIGDALIIISNSLRSGFSIMQAIDLVRKEMPDPIAREFARTFQEINLGIPTEQALANMAERTGSDDMDMVVTAVLIQRQVGGNLAEVLDNIAHTIRERIRIKGEIKALTAQGRISGLIVGLLPVAMAAVFFAINREYISLLFTTRPGLIMVFFALVAQSAGFFAIRRIVDIKY